MPVVISVSTPDRAGWHKVRFPFNRALVDLVKSVPGSRWVPEEKTWLMSGHGLAALAPIVAAAGLGVVNLPGPKTLTCPPLYLQPGKTLRDYQISGLAYLWSHQGFALTFDPRVGKGQRASDNVITPFGPQRFDTLQVGHRVIGSDGKEHRIEGVFRRGKMPVWRVHFRDKTFLDVSGDHLWDVQFYVWRRSARGGGWITKSTEELASEPLFDSEGAARWFIPIVEPVQFEARPAPKIHPYLLGVLLGDGCMSDAGSVRFVPGDEEVPAYLRTLGYKVVKQKQKTRSVAYAIRDVLDDVRDLEGVYGLRSWEKFVPSLYLRGSVSERLALLQGLLDTDGSFEKNVTIFCSMSEQLARDVVWLVQSLGGIARLRSKLPTYRYKGEKRTGRRAYYVSISLDMQLSGCGKKFKSLTKFYPSRAIVKIEKLAEEDEIICIKTSASDQLYVTSNFIVTHNTPTTIAAIAAALAERRAERCIVLYPASVREEWENQLAAWAGLKLTCVEGSKMPPPDEVIEWASTPWLVLGCHYEILGGKGSYRPEGATIDPLPEGLLALADEGPFVIVADEIQNAKNRKVPRTKVMLELSAHKNCVHRWALTGTPMRNRPRDIWALFEFLQPGSMGGYWSFAKRYAGAVEGTYGWSDLGAENEDELALRLSKVSYRLRREDVAAYLPKSDRKALLCSVPKDVQKEYDTEAKRLNAAGVLAGALSEEEPSGTTMKALEQLASITTKAKISVAVDRVRFHAVDRNVKVLVFANFHASLKQVWDALDPDLDESGEREIGVNTKKPLGAIPVFCAGGWMTPDKRYKIREQWKACPGPSVLLANTLSSGIGIDMSDADAAIFVELCYVPADFIQAESRIIDVHLGKRTSPPIFEYLLARGTIDSDMGLALINKVQTINAVVGSDVALNEMSNTLRASGVVAESTISLNKADPAAVQNAIKKLMDRMLGRVSAGDAKVQGALAVGLDEAIDNEVREGDDDL